MPVLSGLSGIKLRNRTEGDGSRTFLHQRQEGPFLETVRKLGPEWLYRGCLKSTENQFSDRILLRTVFDMNLLKKHYPRQFDEASQRTPEKVKGAAKIWVAFERIYFASQGNPVPDWPPYVEIQEGLGRCGTSPIHRFRRKMKAFGRRQLLRVFEKLCIIFPNWKFVHRRLIG